MLDARLKETLISDVRAADQAQTFTKTRQITDLYLKNELLISALIKATRRIQIYETPENLASVGLMGLIRILHVALNRSLKDPDLSDEERQEVMAELTWIRSLYRHVIRENLLNQSIHGQSVDFVAETRQDEATSRLLLGDPQSAMALLNQARADAEAEVKDIDPDPFDKTGTHEGFKQIDYSEYLLRRKWLAEAAVLPVIQMRQGITSASNRYFAESLKSEAVRQQRLGRMEQKPGDLALERNADRVGYLKGKAAEAIILRPVDVYNPLIALRYLLLSK